jgi:hypothetical protein
MTDPLEYGAAKGDRYDQDTRKELGKLRDDVLRCSGMDARSSRP